jgi:hypothetical protein
VTRAPLDPDALDESPATAFTNDTFTVRFGPVTIGLVSRRAPRRGLTVQRAAATLSPITKARVFPVGGVSALRCRAGGAEQPS